LIKLSPEVKNKLNSIGETYQESIEIRLNSYVNKDRKTDPMEYLISTLSEEERNLYGWLKDSNPTEQMIRYAYLNSNKDLQSFYGEIEDKESPFYLKDKAAMISNINDYYSKYEAFKIKVKDKENLLESGDYE
jgi:hypothetical protein